MDKEALRKAMLDAQSMQLDLVNINNELAQEYIEGFSNDKHVSILMSAHGEFLKVKISPSLQSGSLQELEAAVLEALHDATNKSLALTKSKMQSITQKIGL
jgi:DNA-binding protein YbaB